MRFGGLIAAIVVAAVMAVIVLRMSANETPAANNTGAPAQVKSATIYVAAQPIPIGSTVGPEMVVSQAWPEHLMLEGFMRTDSEKSPVGMIARSPFQVQEPILLSKLANAQDPNFIAGSLPKGMRVITIQTNEIEGLAGFVFPGDRIDILLTHDMQKWVTDPVAPGATKRPRQVVDPVTETLLTNVTVLAVDQRASNSNAVDAEGKLLVPQSVSLMVSPTDAQRLRLGARAGTLTLALRSLEDRESADPLIITGIKDISQYPEQESLGATDGGILVIRGTDTEIMKSLEQPLPADAMMGNNPNMPGSR